MPFALLTFLGIFPLNIAMLWLGQIGNFKSIQSFISDAQTYILIAAVVAVCGFLIYKFYLKRAAAANSLVQLKIKNIKRPSGSFLLNRNNT